MIASVEVQGVYLRVEYTLNESNVVEYSDIRVLDVNYQPCGPNMLDLFVEMLVTSDDPIPYGQMRVTPFLSQLQEEF